MEVTSSKRMGSTMFVAALLLWSAIGAKADDSAKCISLCTLLCASDPVPYECSQMCLKGCVGQPSSSVASGLCNVGCSLSNCLDRHPDTQKVEVDMKKFRACMDSHSPGCQKTCSLH